MDALEITKISNAIAEKAEKLSKVAEMLTDADRRMQLQKEHIATIGSLFPTLGDKYRKELDTTRRAKARIARYLAGQYKALAQEIERRPL